MLRPSKVSRSVWNSCSCCSGFSVYTCVWVFGGRMKGLIWNSVNRISWLMRPAFVPFVLYLLQQFSWRSGANETGNVHIDKCCHQKLTVETVHDATVAGNHIAKILWWMNKRNMSNLIFVNRIDERNIPWFWKLSWIQTQRNHQMVRWPSWTRSTTTNARWMDTRRKFCWYWSMKKKKTQTIWATTASKLLSIK